MNSFSLLEEEDEIINLSIVKQKSKKQNQQQDKKFSRKSTCWTVCYESDDIWRNILEFQSVYSLFHDYSLIDKKTFQFIYSVYFFRFLIKREEKLALSYDIEIIKIAKQYDLQNILKLYQKTGKKKKNNKSQPQIVNEEFIPIDQIFKIFKNIYFKIKKDINFEEEERTKIFAGVRKFILNDSTLQRSNIVKTIVNKCSHNEFIMNEIKDTDLSVGNTYHFQFICKNCDIRLLTNFYPHEKPYHYRWRCYGLNRVDNYKLCNYHE
ncbi:hypothetical protein ABK040_008144 [Willaertia magna]